MARLEEPEKPENHERWLITYADMITLLMVFFIVLYASSIVDSNKFQSLAASLQQAFNVDVLQGFDLETTSADPAAAEALVAALKQDVESLRSELDALRGPALSRGDIAVEVNREGILISIYGNLLFDSGKATINYEALDVLQRVARAIATKPYPMRVEGHTDNIPIDTQVYPSNWELSTARATAVVRYLIDSGISPQRVQAVGYGETRPLNGNLNRDQRARNRRVDIQLIYLPSLQALSDADIGRITAGRAAGAQ